MLGKGILCAIDTKCYERRQISGRKEIYVLQVNFHNTYVRPEELGLIDKGERVRKCWENV